MASKIPSWDETTGAIPSWDETTDASKAPSWDETTDSASEKPSLFKRIKEAVVGKSGKLPADPMASRIEEARGRDIPLIKMTAREAPKAASKEEAVAAAERYGMDDEALAVLIRPDAPESVTGLEIQDKRDADYKVARGYLSGRKILEKLAKPTLTPKPPPTTAATDATAAAGKPVQAAQAIPAATLEPKPLTATAPAEATATAVQTLKPEADKEAKLMERAQSLAEALPSFAKGAVKGVTAGVVDPTQGTEGAPGAIGQIAGNLAGGAAASLAGPAGAPAFLMTQFLTDLEERGMDPAKLADPEILALAATSGLFGGLTPVAFGKKALTRALTGAGLGAAQNLAEEDIAAAITATEPERLKALILGGAFGAGFGAAFRESAKVREAVEAKLKPEEVKVLDEVVEGLPPRAEEDVAADMARTDQSSTTKITPEMPPAAEIRAEMPVVEAPVAGVVDQPVTVAEAGGPEGAATPEAPRAESAAAITPEAEALLKSVDEGGVPGMMTNNLKRIASENGVDVTPEMTPNDVIGAIRAKREAQSEAPELTPKIGEQVPENAPPIEAPVAKPSAPPDASPTKPFGSTPEGVVRAPSAEESNTSARKTYTTRDRADMGLDDIPSPERVEWQSYLDEAVDKKLDSQAETLARTIVEADVPRALTGPETAGMVRRMADLKNQHEAALDNLAKTTDPAIIAEQSRALRDIEDKFDLVSKAVRYSGTEKGRNLAAQKLTINKSYDLVHVLSRAKAAKGKDLTPEERVKFEEMTKQIKERDARIAELEVKARDTQAREAIKERARRPRKPQEVKAQIADLTEKTRRLLRAGCLTS